MTKTKLEKIAGIEEQILQLENQRKLLLQKQKEDDRKARTKRLIERGAILESLISGAETMSNEQVKSILGAALSGKATAQVATFVPAGKELAPNETPKAVAEVKGALIYHMNMVCAVCRRRFVPIGTKENGIRSFA